MEFFSKMRVYDHVTRTEATKSGKGKIIKGRWIDVNKGDSQNPDYRSRFVGKEFNTGVDSSLFAATPPLEALKLLLGSAATGEGRETHLMLSDVKRAYFHAPATRELYVEVPREDPQWKPGLLGRLRLSLYGTRDAAANWQKCVADHLISLGFRQGKSNPCVFWHQERGIRTLVHGDDYASAGSYSSLKWLEGQLAKRFDMKTKIVGLSGKADVVEEGKILNRVVRVTKDGWEYESDQRHVEIMLEQLELTSCKPLGTPGVEEAACKEEHVSVPLSAEATSQYRAITARANYLAQDRSDIQYAVKELCRRMSDPDEECWARLRRLGRYLRGRSRAVTKFPWQATTWIQDVYSDANWAGCKTSRKSTSGGALLLGSHCLKTWSKTQGTIAQSSAESELLGIVKAASEALGMVSLAADFGIELMTRLHVDASAALGILERRGVGRVRHLDVGSLWLQEQHLRKVIEFTKVSGTANPADLMTKHLSKDLVDGYMVHLGFVFREGHAGATAQLHSAQEEVATDNRERPQEGATARPQKKKAAAHKQKVWLEFHRRWKSHGILPRCKGPQSPREHGSGLGPSHQKSHQGRRVRRHHRRDAPQKRSTTSCTWTPQP